MSDKINVEEIFSKCAIWDKLDIEDQLALKFASKLLVEVVVDKCAENAKAEDKGEFDREAGGIWVSNPVVDKQSILQVNQMVQYE